MLARQFWIATAVEILAYGLIVVGNCGESCSAFTVALQVVAVYLLVRVVLVAASFGITAIFGAPRPRPYRIGAARAAWMYLEELLTSLLTFSVLQPSEPWLDLREPPPGTRRSANPILLVHGFLGNGAVWWSLRRRLIKTGFDDVYTVNLEPTTGDIEDLARRLQGRVAAILEDAPGAKITLVCHSMGGLVARVLVERLRTSERVRGIITLGTPHHGTVLARLLSGTNVCQMRCNCDWLERLNRAGDSSGRTPLISIFSYHDNIVAPQESAWFEWGENLPLAGLGHMALLYAPQSQAAVIRALQRLALPRRR